MAVTVDELAFIVDSTVSVCIEDETTGLLTVSIPGLGVRVGGGPELREVEGRGFTANAARDDYATKVSGQVVIMQIRPEEEYRVPPTIIGFDEEMGP